MGIHTRVYEIEGQLAINIPTQALPEGKIQLVEEIVIVPGYEAQTTTWYDVLVRPYKGRTAVHLTYSEGVSPDVAMETLGLDTSKPIWIKLYNSSRWIRAHYYHGSYGRVWIPTPVVRRTRIREYEVYPVIIRGTTLPVTTKKIVRKRVRNVIVSHFNREYNTENYAVNRWRWIIPDHIVCHPILKRSLELGVTPECECHLVNDIIQVDFIFSDVSGKFVSRDLGFAYRSMAVRNYTATVDVDYPFLVEIRATILTNCPKEFYQNPHQYQRLMDALGITVANMTYFFTKSVRHAEKVDKVKFIQTRIDKLKIADLDYDPVVFEEYPLINETEGEEENMKISFGETMDYPFYKAIKYIRIINEQSYKRRGDNDYIYLNDEIEDVLHKNPLVDVDANGFVWITREWSDY